MPKVGAARKLARLARAATGCRRCPLYCNATQTVFGEGPTPAPLMLVGEQPGDREDIVGRPFVGPAGRLLDKALSAAGATRPALYLTNVVKHFKNEPRGKKRLHKRPNRYEVEVCRVWIDQEIALVRPKLVVALGVTAAEALLGRRVVISRERGRTIELAEGELAGGARAMVTTHPSAILRLPDREARKAALDLLVRDLRRAWRRSMAA